MTSNPTTTQPKRYTNSKSATASSLEHSYEGPQAYNISGPELDLRKQPPLELAYREPSTRGLQHEAAPSQGNKTRPFGLRRSTILLLVALVAAIICIAVVSSTVGSLVKKEKADASSDSKDASAINNRTVILSRTTVFAQSSASRTTTSSLSSSSISSSSSSSSSSSCSPYSSSSSTSSSSPSSNEGSRTITLGPSETYSIQSSPSLTLSRDCPGSNGTTIVTHDDPHQSFVKNCNWLYNSPEPNGDVFRAVTSTLDACISLCAENNRMNGTGPFGHCTAVEWRWNPSEDSAGFCYGKSNQEAGKGDSVMSGNNAPADAAFFLGWSQ